MINSFFVYGTLMKGKWNDERLFDSVGQYRTSVKKGVINGRIYAVASFPGVKLNDENSLVYGELHTFPEERMPEFLRVYDRLEGYVEGREGNLYDRRVVTVTLESGQEVQAYVYEFARDVDESIRILDGHWTENSFREVEKRNKKTMSAGK